MDIQKINYQNEKLNVEINCYVDKRNNIWFRGKEIALILGYKNTKDAIKKHVDDEDKKLIGIEKSKPSFRPSKSRGCETQPLLKSHLQTYNCIFINESGFYSLIFSSKMPLAMRGLKII